MEFLTFKITPYSAFATVPKGDTLFGQIVSYLFLEGDMTFENYLSESPKLIVSDMMPFGYLYKPTLPLACFKDESGVEIDKKELRKRDYISVENLQNGNLDLCEKIEFEMNFSTVKNSIDRTSFSTGKDDFAPYSTIERVYFRELWMFMLVDSAIKDKIIDTLIKIGEFGFGKEANQGKGHFGITSIDNPVAKKKSSYYMSLSPTILQQGNFTRSWYEPFTRFGKYGLHNAHTNAFKKPVLMAQSGAVVCIKEEIEYFGRSIDNSISEGKPSFIQGRSIAIPIMLKDEKCLNIV
jgi:CRISPR-associated protein Csm4